MLPIFAKFRATKEGSHSNRKVLCRKPALNGDEASFRIFDADANVFLCVESGQRAEVGERKRALQPYGGRMSSLSFGG